MSHFLLKNGNGTIIFRPISPIFPFTSPPSQRRRCSPSHTLARWPSLLSFPTRSARTQTSRRCARRPSRAPCFALAPAARAGALPAHRASVRPPRPVTYHEMRRLALLVARRAKHTGAPACAPSRRSAAMAEPGAGAEGDLCVCGHPECERRGRERVGGTVKKYDNKETPLKHFRCTHCGEWRASHCVVGRRASATNLASWPGQQRRERPAGSRRRRRRPPRLLLARRRGGASWGGGAGAGGSGESAPPRWRVAPSTMIAAAARARRPAGGGRPRR